MRCSDDFSFEMYRAIKRYSSAEIVYLEAGTNAWYFHRISNAIFLRVLHKATKDSAVSEY